MTVRNVYNRTLKGSVIMVGNAIGLFGAGGVANFTTAIPAPPSGGTTTAYTSNSNSVNLQVPLTGKVVRAELSWLGYYETPIPFNNSIFLKDPKGVTSTVARNPVNTQFISNNYTQSVDVTTLIQAGGNGFYTVSQVPCTLGGSGSGYILIVAYEDPTETFRNINIWSMFELPSLGVATDVVISGFSTPSTGNVLGKLIIAASAGNPEQGGDTVRFGLTGATGVILSGPNNLPNNFFASQINNNLGLLDTTGTWGNANATPGSPPTVGNRVWYDVTRVDASAGLTNNQTSGVVRLLTSSDFILAHAMALQVDVNSANLSPISKVSNTYFAQINDTITYTVSFGNSGLVTANNVNFIDTIPNGLSFVPNTVIINGASQGTFNPNAPGFSLGNVAPNSRVTISFKALVTTIPSPNPAENSANVSYSFISAPGINPISSTETSNIVLTKVDYVVINSTKEVNKKLAFIGDILTYTIPLTNTGSTTANNLVFIDTIPNGTTLVPGSFKQGSIAVGSSPNPPGASLPTPIAGGQTSIITFQVIITTNPNPNPIANSAAISFDYFTGLATIVNSSNTNIVNTSVNYASLGNITKFVDKSFADCGDVITYTIVAPNSGTVTALNVVFKDTIPNGTVLVADSVFVNGNRQSGANPSSGVTIPNIGPGATATLTFSVKVQC